MILILAALKEEIKPILDEMEIVETVRLRPAIIFKGEYLGKEIVVAHTGVGAGKMAHATEFCINEYKPEKCVNIGYCGALTPNLSIGDMVIAEKVISETNEVEVLSSIDLSAICTKADIKFYSGTVLTVDKPASTPHEKAYLGTKFGAVAVDMESFGLARVAEKARIPFGIARSVLDPMDIHLPAFSNVISDSGAISAVNVAANIVMRPKNILQLPQLQFAASKARETLMRFVNEFVKS